MQMIKSRIKFALQRLGFEVSRFLPENSRVCRLGSRLKALNVDLVLDVGANVGQYAIELRESGYTKRIISFEPLSSAYHKLLVASADDPNWQIAPRCALGSSSGETFINISLNSWSSSLRQITELHTKAAPNSISIGSEKVSIFSLDDLALEDVHKALHPYLKIDAQGYEDEVLFGARNVLQHLAGLQLELSLNHLYEGQPDFIEMINWINQQGFELFGIEPEFYDPQSSRLLQMDAIFCKKQGRA
jgi:FkbM family methyltransferase